MTWGRLREWKRSDSMRILIILALFLVLYYLVRGLFRPGKGERETPRTHPDVDRVGGNELVKDPLCQTYVPKRSAVRKRFRGEDVFFCSQECMERYLRGKG